MNFAKRSRALIALLSLTAAFAMVTIDFADARRGGSFGSRGFRTFQPPAATRTAPRETAPVERSMTPRTETGQPGAAQRQPGTTAQAQRQGMFRNGFGGMFGGLLGGLMLGGLIGMLMGNGLGGLAGFFGLILQLGLLALGVMLVMRLFRRQRSYEPQPLGASASAYSAGGGRGQDAPPRGVAGGMFGGGGTAQAAPAPAETPGSGIDEIGIGQQDLDAFERLLGEIQDAFAREDYAALRTRCTPEIVSYLSEELSQNAVNGLRNDVSDVKLLQGDLAESWREGNEEYATVALHYESRDVMRERESGRIVSGDAEAPTATTEIWTFVRPAGGAWKLSAIQDA
ncbi:Tim44 domain-containing protein [Lutibaculum baratangense]|uniref:Tim44-like domain-containing protein n=1 Tax=Lutibaculum baratangense AMV1 TaxID=631454 RepID=V4RDF4_9HYPH|nr:TIM44-like domain-containing protein [Lutibaculum baratangense]ESR24191.1 hypothetical protein N177_2640 [Lutibaculum baratangense AMV1]